MIFHFEMLLALNCVDVATSSGMDGWLVVSKTDSHSADTIGHHQYHHYRYQSGLSLTAFICHLRDIYHMQYRADIAHHHHRHFISSDSAHSTQKKRRHRQVISIYHIYPLPPPTSLVKFHIFHPTQLTHASFHVIAIFCPPY